MILKQIILLMIGASLLLLAVRRLRQYRLKERYTLVFVFIGLPFLLLALWPNAMGWVSEKLEIDYRTVMLLTVTVCFLLLGLELLTIVSLQDRKITALAQALAILMQKRQQDQSPSGSGGSNGCASADLPPADRAADPPEDETQEDESEIAGRL